MLKINNVFYSILISITFNVNNLYSNKKHCSTSYLSSLTLPELKSKALNGDAYAQFRIGQMHLKGGESVPQSYKEAFKYFTMAAEQGLRRAQYMVGLMHYKRMYYKRIGINQNYEESFKYFYMAGEQGLPSAQYRVGLMYAKGHGVSKSDKEAVKWFTEAANQGHPKAKIQLKEMRLL